MPVIHGYGRRSISRNISTEMRAGKSQKQAVAIALNEARRAAEKRGHPEIAAKLTQAKESAPTIHCEACGREKPANGAAKYTKGLGSWHLCASCKPKKTTKRKAS